MTLVATLRIFAAAVVLAALQGCLNEGVESTSDSQEPVRASVPLPSGTKQHPASEQRPSSPRAEPARPSSERPTSEHPISPERSSSAGTTRTPPAVSFNATLSAWYSQRANYELVMKDVSLFYKPVRDNGCVAFLSAALRRLGVNVPIDTEGTESPSLVTLPFSRFLEGRLGWKRVTSAEDLRSGDIVFTRDNPSYPGYPAHTYLFQDWSHRETGIALVIDNQDFTHERNIYDNETAFNFTPFSYALRAP
ncbi:MAG: hypothetical protein RIR26_4 [Pseudomonadota bacterium]